MTTNLELSKAINCLNHQSSNYSFLSEVLPNEKIFVWDDDLRQLPGNRRLGWLIQSLLRKAVPYVGIKASGKDTAQCLQNLYFSSLQHLRQIRISSCEEDVDPFLLSRAYKLLPLFHRQIQAS